MFETAEDVLRWHNIKTIPQAEAIMMTLGDEIATIDKEIGLRRQELKDGVRSPALYFSWLKRARVAREVKITQRRLLKAWLHEQRQQVEAQRRASPIMAAIDADDPDALLLASYLSIRRLCYQVGWDQVGDDDKTVLDYISAYLVRRPVR